MLHVDGFAVYSQTRGKHRGIEFAPTPPRWTITIKESFDSARGQEGRAGAIGSSRVYNSVEIEKERKISFVTSNVWKTREF